MITDYTAEEFEFNGDLVCLEVRIEFSISPYVPASRDCPPEGGEIEDMDPTVTSIAWEDESRVATKDELQKATKAFSDLIDNDHSLCSQIEERCYESAADRWDDDHSD